MTRLLIDQREVAPLSQELSSVNEVVQMVGATYLPPDRVIRQIEVDGRPLISDDLPVCLTEHIHERDKIEIHTGTLIDASIDAMREATGFLERIENDIPMLAGSFRLLPGPGDFRNLKQVYEGFYWLNLLIDRLESSFGISLDSLPAGSATAREHQVNLIAALRAATEAHERRDYAGVANLLEFEILPLIPGCRRLFLALRQHIGK